MKKSKLFIASLIVTALGILGCIVGITQLSLGTVVFYLGVGIVGAGLYLLFRYKQNPQQDKLFVPVGNIKLHYWLICFIVSFFIIILSSLFSSPENKTTDNNELSTEPLTEKITEKVTISTEKEIATQEPAQPDNNFLYENDIFSIRYSKIKVSDTPDTMTKIFFTIENKTDKSYVFGGDAVIINGKKFEVSDLETVTANTTDEVTFSVFDFNLTDDVNKIGVDLTYFVENKSIEYTKISIPQRDLETGEFEEPTEIPTEKPTEKPTEPPTPEPTQPPTEKIINETDNSNYQTYDNPQQQNTTSYVLNTHTKKVHKSSCSDVKRISPENYATTNDLNQALADGYSPCQRCNP